LTSSVSAAAAAAAAQVVFHVGVALLLSAQEQLLGMPLTSSVPAAAAAVQVVFRVGVALLLSAQEQLLGMPFERLVEGLNGRKFPLLARHPDALMKVC
jgi:alpha-D-ribose 1-methylphosphonate 5-triphosphate synthase subunit PhnH